MLRAVATGWVVEQINFVAGNCGSVMEGDFYGKLDKLDVQAGKKDSDKIFSDHVTQVLMTAQVSCTTDSWPNSR